MNYLSGPELVMRNKEAQKLSSPVIGRSLKNKYPDESAEAKLAIASLQDDLLKMLSQERIERTVVRSQATYDVDEYGDACIVVTRKMGKWNQFGYTSEKGFCLTENEALYLVEMNRLELYYGSVIVSLEQAYALLLETNLTAPAYFAYAQLMRTGYNVELYNLSSNVEEELQTECYPVVRECRSVTEECVWRCLMEKLNSETFKEANVSDEIFLKTKQSMLQIANAIKRTDELDNVDVQSSGQEQCTSDPSIASEQAWQGKVTGKRKSEEEPNVSNSPKKKSKITHAEPTPFGSSYHSKVETCYLDILLCDITDEFQSIFKEIQVIQLMPIDFTLTDDVVDEFEFDFDLYAANANYRKSSPGIPIYRIIVIGAGQPLPSTLAIARCYKRQSQRVPVLVIIMNDSMAMHGFVYKVSV